MLPSPRGEPLIDVDWISRWGYAAIVRGTFLEGESARLVGAALAHAGTLHVRGAWRGA
jgi:hypothetical protein